MRTDLFNNLFMVDAGLGAGILIALNYEIQLNEFGVFFVRLRANQTA